MAARTYLFWLLLALISGAVFAQTTPSQIKWAPDLATAKQASAQFKVPLMIHFHGDGCVPCRTLEKNVFANPEVTQVLNKFFICVSINGSRDQKTMSEYGVHNYPTDVFLSPSGETLFQGVSPQDVRNYLGTLERVAVMNRDRNIAAAARKDTSSSTIAQQATTTAGMLVSTSSNGSTLPGLPPPGFGNTSNSAQSGFYQAEGAQATQQQLPIGASSGSLVQSGPLLGSQQPISITGSTPQAQTQTGFIPSLNSTAKNSSDLGGLPFPPLSGPTNNGQLPQLSRETTSPMGAYSQVATTTGPQTPTVPSGAMGMTAQVAQRNSPNAQWNGGVTNQKTTVDNPHFQSNTAGNLVAQSSTTASPASVSTNNSGFTASQALPSGQTAIPALAMPALAIPTLPTLTSSPVLVQKTEGTLANATRLVSAQTTAQTSASATIEQTPVIDGYCPVSLRSKQWKKGESQFSVKHRGLLFNMADQACLDEFLNNPDYYTPLLLGSDPMLLLKQGRLVPGSTQHGLFEDKFGALFFESAESKAEFHRNFSTNMDAIEKILQRAAGRN